MIYWYNLPQTINKKQIDSGAYPCLFTDKFNKTAKDTKWANIIPSVKALFKILGKEEKVYWYNLPQKVEELMLSVDIYDCN